MYGTSHKKERKMRHFNLPKYVLSTLTAILASVSISNAQELLKPDETFLFATKDSLDLYMDVYYPADGSEYQVEGVNKPTIIYMFGGGFKGGSRDDAGARRWFRYLTDEGFTVASIDYRLGLKDATKAGLGQAKAIYNAIVMAVEDLYSATNFIIENSEEVDIDPSSLVISGSSAGAISVMQAEWELCNRSELASVLPEDFRYAGVMSFAGAIYSKKGSVRYKREPAPTLMLHGTSDKIVNYNQIKVLNLAFQGSGKLSKRFKSQDYDYNIYRFLGNGHEIAGAMVKTVPEQIRFLESNVIGKNKRVIDVKIDDPSIAKFPISNRKELYSE